VLYENTVTNGMFNVGRKRLGRSSSQFDPLVTFPAAFAHALLGPHLQF
jgi:hypothetical protein